MTTPRRQCTAKAKGTGKRCRQRPIRGGTVCHKHGGSAPQVKAAAARRLAVLVDPAISVLEKTLRAVNEHPAQALAAAKDVLDRTGHKSPDELDIISTSATIDLDAVEGMSTEELETLVPLLRKVLGHTTDGTRR